MVFKQMLELYDILDDINADGRRVEEYLRSIQKDADVEAYPIYGDKGKTDVVKVCVHGSNGKGTLLFTVIVICLSFPFSNIMASLWIRSTIYWERIYSTPHCPCQ